MPRGRTAKVLTHRYDGRSLTRSEFNVVTVASPPSAARSKAGR